ncbi:hypothetical protein [uncultured Desulfosarcina sp.]|uniref:hypothetical protein n=1 Tax=uncultured Desulfosarcina sp. TaxID=218289 RepID=UPI0029C7CBF8|nr:hypothetical protein [uncultured Desulfosarcina sp.]
MANRRPVQQAHERYFVDQFLIWINSAYRSNFKVTSEPNPPDAIIRSSKTTRWVEVSTAFWTFEYARDLYSYATPNEPYKPVVPGPYYDMDHFFANEFVSVVSKKLEKKSYIPWKNKYGPGYLIVPIKHPWFDGETIRVMKDLWNNCIFNDLGCFRSVRIAFPSLKKIKFYRWPKK